VVRKINRKRVNILFARHYSFIANVEGCFERKILLNRFFFPKLTGLNPAEPDVSILQHDAATHHHCAVDKTRA